MINFNEFLKKHPKCLDNRYLLGNSLLSEYPESKSEIDLIVSVYDYVDIEYRKKKIPDLDIQSIFSNIVKSYDHKTGIKLSTDIVRKSLEETLIQYKEQKYSLCFEDLLYYAEQGNAEAQKSLGYCYHTGKGVEKDYKEAVKWYRLSVEQGNAAAQNNLGVCYYNGEGVEKDYKEAVKWYRLSAEQGYAWAQNNLGNCYYYGKGVFQDDDEAKRWLEKASAQGNTSACALLKTVNDRIEKKRRESESNSDCFSNYCGNNTSSFDFTYNSDTSYHQSEDDFLLDIASGVYSLNPDMPDNFIDSSGI